MWTIFKVFTEFVTTLLLFYALRFVLVWFFGRGACGILALSLGIERLLPAQESEVP